MLDRRQFIGTGGLLLAGLASGCAPRPGAPPAVTGAAPPPVIDIVPPPIGGDLVKDIQERAFRYFWDTTDPANGLAPDRWPTPSFASIAAVGFALTAYPVGVVNGWVTREAARVRTLATLRFFAGAPMGKEPTGFSGYKGFFYHFLGTTKGQRFALSELSTIDTALLMGGVLFAQSWFDQDHPEEKEIRGLADQLYGAIEWDWITPRAPFVAMGWHPESGFIGSDWNIYNESLILYVLALGSPTHPLPPETWDKWTASFDPSWDTSLINNYFTGFAPLFGHQYSQVWLDFRDMVDSYSKRRGITYFENSRRATFAQQRYAINNPGGFVGYGQDVWGLTACDGPGDFKRVIGGRERGFFSYSARGPGDRDDGTIAPTAALGSIAFAADIVVPAARAMRDRYGAGIYGKYGFLDSFNLTLTDPDVPLKHGKIVPGIGWVNQDYLGIDQGPIVAMIENQRTNLIWKTMARNPHVRRGLERAGFTGGILSR